MAISTDCAATMTGNQRGLVVRVQALAPHVVSTHCMIHREALVAKKLTEGAKEESPLTELMRDVVQIVNAIKARPKSSQAFTELCEEMQSAYIRLLFEAEVRWLSRGTVLQRVASLRDELRVYFTKLGDEKATRFADLNWVVRLSYMADVFAHLNQLNLSLQGKGRGDIFVATNSTLSNSS